MRIFKAGLLILALVMALALPAASQQDQGAQQAQNSVDDIDDAGDLQLAPARCVCLHGSFLLFSTFS